MILGSWEPLEVGKRYERNIRAANRERCVGQPFIVLRAATVEEWRDSVLAHGGTPTARHGNFFYEVSVD